MVASGSKILALDERGEILLIDASPSEFKIVSRQKISEQPAWAHLAVSGSEVVIRTLGELSLYRWSE
jgi:hypothetical protein